MAVGSVDGQLQGLRMVVRKVQSVSGHSLPQARFWIVRVAVGQTASAAWASARLARLRRAVKVSFIVDGELVCGCAILR